MSCPSHLSWLDYSISVWRRVQVIINVYIHFVHKIKILFLLIRRKRSVGMEICTKEQWALWVILGNFRSFLHYSVSLFFRTSFVSLRQRVGCVGRAIAQAVSHRLSTAAARVQTWVWSCGIFWWTKVALGHVFFPKNFGFPCHSTFHLLLHNHHLHYHPRLAQ
jgi:hypothetical protein